MVDTHTYLFMDTLTKYDYLVQPYGTKFSTCRYNGTYYDDIFVFDTNVFNCSAFTLVRTIDTIMIYRKKEES